MADYKVYSDKIQNGADCLPQVTDEYKNSKGKSNIQVDYSMLNKNSHHVEEVISTGKRPQLLTPQKIVDRDELESLKKYAINLLSEFNNPKNINEMNNNAKHLIEKYNNKHNVYIKTSESYKFNVESIEQSIRELSITNKRYKKYNNKLVLNEEKLTQMEKKLSETGKSDKCFCTLQDQISITQKNIEDIKTQRNAIKTSLNKTVEHCNVLIGQAEDQLDELTKQEEENGLVANICLDSQIKSNRTTTSQFIMLIGSLLQIISDNNIKTMESQSKITQEINQARENKLQSLAKKYSISMKVIKWINRGVLALSGIFSVAMIGLGLILAIPSGGTGIAAALAITGGIFSAALLIINISCLAFGGFSLTGEVMSKVMEGVTWLNEHANLKCLFIAEILKACNFDDNVIDNFKHYYSVVASMVQIAAISVVGTVFIGAAISGIASALSETVVETVAKQITDGIKNTVEKAIKAVSEKLLHLLQKAGTALELIARNRIVIGISMDLLNQCASAVLQFFGGLININSTSDYAKIQLTEESMSIIKKYRDSIMQLVDSMQDAIRDMISILMNTLINRTQALNKITTASI